MRVYETSELLTLGIPKVGSTTMAHVLGGLDSYILGRSHDTPSMLEARFPDEFERLRGFHKVSFVREPFQRFSSSVAQYLTEVDPGFVISNNLGLGILPSRKRAHQSCKTLIFDIMERINSKEPLISDSNLRHFRFQSDYLKPAEWADNARLVKLGNFSALKNFLVSEVGIDEGLVIDPGVTMKRSTVSPISNLGSRNQFFSALHKVLPGQILSLYQKHYSWFGAPFNRMHKKTMDRIDEEMSKDQFTREWRRVFGEDIELWNESAKKFW